MALEGGIGVIHTNMSVEDQVKEVMKVKKYKSGFAGFPVTEDGRMGSKLLGLVTKRDADFVQDRTSTTVSQIMTKLEDLVTASEGITIAAANEIIRDSKKGKLPIV